jgi:putative transposase|tara:strand:- start:227 stop:559 length:333 start_codon:yes stop_codon:yes gene_type:complete
LGNGPSWDFRSSETSQSWEEKRAQKILEKGGSHYGESRGELIKRHYGDWTRTLLAWTVWKETSMSHRWIAENLNLKSAANSSQQIRRFSQADEQELPPKIRKWKKPRNAA